MNIKLLTEHHFEFLTLIGGCPGSSESIHVKMPHYWKSHVAAHIYVSFITGFVSNFDGTFETNAKR